MSEENKKKIPMFNMKKVWGPIIWSLMHTMAYVADVSPDAHKSDVVQFFNNMVLPCKMCQKHYAKALPVTLNDRHVYPVSRWVYKLHKKVSKRVKGAKYKPPMFKTVLQRSDAYLRELRKPKKVK